MEHSNGYSPLDSLSNHEYHQAIEQLIMEGREYGQQQIPCPADDKQILLGGSAIHLIEEHGWSIERVTDWITS